jgi:hypothetical protein
MHRLRNPKKDIQQRYHGNNGKYIKEGAEEVEQKIKPKKFPVRRNIPHHHPEKLFHKPV